MNIYISITVFCISLIWGCDNILDQNQEDEDEEIVRSLSKTIERVYDSEFEAKLIQKAEDAYLPRDSVITVLDEANVYLGSFKPPQEKYWFWSIGDDVLIPFAITEDAINYYTSVIDSVKSGESYQILKDIDFVYKANIDFYDEYKFSWPPITESMGPTTPTPPEKSFNNVFVVHMTLRWYHVRIEEYCLENGQCYKNAMTIIHERIVVFDDNGNILNIFLDGLWPVSIT